jgi:hypothetical protein
MVKPNTISITISEELTKLRKLPTARESTISHFPAWRTHPSRVRHERFGRYDTVFSLVGSEPTTTAEGRPRITRSSHGYKCDRTGPTIGPLVDTTTSPKTLVFLVLFSKAGWDCATLSPRICSRTTLQHRVLESTIPIECHRGRFK